MRKLCRDCGKKRDISNFGNRINYTKSGSKLYLSNCKACSVVRSQKYYQANKKKCALYQKTRNAAKKNESPKRKLR